MERDPEDGSVVEEVACGYAHTVARTASGNVWVWGLNVKGQLGLGDTTSRYTPVLLQEQDLGKSREHTVKVAASGKIGSASNVAFRQLGPARVRAPQRALSGAGEEGKGEEDAPKRRPLPLLRPKTPLDIAAEQEVGAPELVSPAAYVRCTRCPSPPHHTHFITARKLTWCYGGVPRRAGTWLRP